MFILYGVLLGLAAGALLRGHLSGLADLRFRWAPLAMLGFAFQVALFADPVAQRIGALGPPLYVGSTVIVLAAVLRNWRIPGIALVAIGAICNLAAILANGGYMPTTAEALGALGGAEYSGYTNSAIVSDPRLLFLGDVFVMPDWMPLANVFSIGDVLIALGVAITLATAMRGARSDRPSRAGTVVTVTALPTLRGGTATALARADGIALPALALASVIGYFLVVALERARL
jgi:hypothetical protein